MLNDTVKKGDPADKKSEDEPKWSRRWRQWWIAKFRWLIPVILIGIGTLLYISWYHVKASENTQFFVIGLLGFGTLIVIIVQAVIYRQQWQAMNDSLSRTDQIIEQNTALVTAMQTQVDLMEDSLQQSDEAVEQAKQTLIYSQRAYVTASLKGINHDRGDKRGHVLVDFENAGNTPANDVSVCYNIEYLKEPPECCKADAVKPVVWDVGTCETIGVIAPKKLTPKTFYMEAVSPKQSVEFHGNLLFLYCWGTITYTDVFRDGRRKSTFAFVQSVDDQAGSQCEAGNEAY